MLLLSLLPAPCYPAARMNSESPLLKYRPLAVWLSGAALYAGDFLVKRVPPWREPVDISIGLDLHIPFYPGWAWVYLLAWLVFVFGTAGWYLFEHWDDWPQVRALLFAALFMQVGAWIVHTAIPTYMPRPSLGDGSPWLITQIYSTDPPTHALPSLHVASVVVAAWFFCRSAPRLRVLASLVFLVLISLSVLFTKQHGVLDVVAGIGWGYGACLAGFHISQRLTHHNVAQADVSL